VSEEELFEEVLRLCEAASISDVVDALVQVCRVSALGADELTVATYERAAQQLEALDHLFV